MGQDIEPVKIRLTGAEKGREWVKVLAISVHTPRGVGPYLVHCVLDEDRAHRIEEYLTRVATRSNPNDDGENEARFTLTKRERQILDLLVEDETLHGIASKLSVSHATVRNHVQHMLTKLGVHSTMEAVAYYLLEKDS
ncbi:MAG: response regulator transcription factor [Candidatus Krumholzibacteria bacterium]|nr:response regulator transcription factor [Candidatus Krumholzibacteria bacterium]